MSFLARLLRSTLSSKDDEAEIVLAASPTGSKKAGPTDTDRKKIVGRAITRPDFVLTVLVERLSETR